MLVPGIPLAEERRILIARCAAASDGLSGREIRTVLRTAFPRALIANPDRPVVRWEHLQTAITDVIAANRNVGRQQVKPSNASADAGRRLLGLGDEFTR
jgi:AAA+ superfamily predicted ATPase